MDDVKKLEALLALVEKGGVEWAAAEEYADRAIHPHRCVAGEYLAHSGQPLRWITLQLSGRATVLKYTLEGGSVRSGAAAGTQLYGLYELLCGLPENTATIQADGPVLCVQVEPELYRSALQKSHAVALYSLGMLAAFTDRMLNRSDRLFLNTPYENLLLYLYDTCAGQPLPARLAERKSHIAETLNINLRTLYRYLDRLADEGVIQRKNGKILLDREGFAALEALALPVRTNLSN